METNDISNMPAIPVGADSSRAFPAPIVVDNSIPFGVDAEAPEPIEYTAEQLEELNRDYT